MRSAAARAGRPWALFTRSGRVGPGRSISPSPSPVPAGQTRGGVGRACCGGRARSYYSANPLGLSGVGRAWSGLTAGPVHPTSSPTLPSPSRPSPGLDETSYFTWTNRINTWEGRRTRARNRKWSVYFDALPDPVRRSSSPSARVSIRG